MLVNVDMTNKQQDQYQKQLKDRRRKEAEERNRPVFVNKNWEEDFWDEEAQDYGAD